MSRDRCHRRGDHDALRRLTARSPWSDEPLGRSVQFAYDASHNLTTLGLPGGITYSYSYDADGNLTGESDPLGHRSASPTTRRLNRLTAASPMPAATSRPTATTPSGNLTSITYADGTAKRTPTTPWATCSTCDQPPRPDRRLHLQRPPAR